LTAISTSSQACLFRVNHVNITAHCSNFGVSYALLLSCKQVNEVGRYPTITTVNAVYGEIYSRKMMYNATAIGLT